MATRGQTQDDYIGVSPMKNDNALELFPFGYSGANIPIHFPFGYQHFSSGAVRDLDMATNVGEQSTYPWNNPVEQDVAMSNDISMIDNQVFSFPSVGVEKLSSTSNDMMNAYQGVNRVSHFENIHGSLITDSINASSIGAGDFDMSALDAETQNNRRQPADISRSFTNISSEHKFTQSILPRNYYNQVRVHSCQPNSEEDKLDGGFLSLGYQDEVATFLHSHGGKVSHTSDTSFSSQCQMIDSSLNNVKGGLDVFENNIDDTVTPLDCGGNQTLSGDGYYGLQAMRSGFYSNPITSIDEGMMNIHHYIPTPSRSGIKTDSTNDLSDPYECSRANTYMPSNDSSCDDGSSRFKKRRMQKVPFNSSVLKRNHLNAAEPQQNSHLVTNFLLPLSGTSAGESGSQDTSGQGADITVNNELPCASSAVKKDSRKRIINLPPRATTQNQRRKIMPQISIQQFSPNLLQNALDKVVTGHSEQVISSSMKATTLKDFSASGGPRNTSGPLTEGTIGTSSIARDLQHPTALSAAFVPPIHIPPTCTSSVNSLASLAKTSTIPVVSVDSLPLVSSPVNATTTALARKMASCSGSSRIPISATFTKKVMTANISPSAYRLSSDITPRRSPLLPTSSTMNLPGCTDWKKSSPIMAALAKTDSALRASQVLGSMSHIKWQGFDTPPTIGFKCMICNRDLSFTPDGPVLQPPIPPGVAVLACGHTFHDQCLLLITPEDQSTDPPCIPCAMEN